MKNSLCLFMSILNLTDTQLNRIQTQAWSLARQLPKARFKHVSVILRGKTILAFGSNHPKTHPKAKEMGYRDACRHSELDAYIRVPYNRRACGLTLINFRFNNRGEMRMSKPCCHCMPWCLEAFDKIAYTTANSGWEIIE